MVAFSVDHCSLLFTSSPVVCDIQDLKLACSVLSCESLRVSSSIVRLRASILFLCSSFASPFSPISFWILRSSFFASLITLLLSRCLYWLSTSCLFSSFSLLITSSIPFLKPLVSALKPTVRLVLSDIFPPSFIREP